MACTALVYAAALSAAPPAWSNPIINSTGLPTYPNLKNAAMDRVLHTEALGRWCARFTASSPDSLTAVADWYRKALLTASETDLEHDEQFGRISALTGVKLAIGRDYVAVYRLPDRPTVIELHRCTWLR